MALNGKGMFIWQLWNTESEDPEAIAALAKEADFLGAIVWKLIKSRE